MSKIHCIFSSNYTLGRSILTLDEPEEINHLSPISIFSIVKKHKLSEINIRDKDFSGFISAYKNSQKVGLPFYFGLKLKVCNDLAEPEENIENSTSYISLWLSNSKGYSEALKLTAQAENNIIDWEVLNQHLTENLTLTIPFYGSFLFNNNFKGFNCIPNFGQLKPELEISDMAMPFDELNKEIVNSYAQKNGHKTINTHLSYFYSSRQFRAYQNFRINSTRKFFKKGSEATADDKQSFTNPGLDFFCSRDFSFERFCIKTNQNFENAK